MGGVVAGGEPFALSETVGFVDDRLRAVQKDLVTLLGTLPRDDDDDDDDDDGDDDDGSEARRREGWERRRTSAADARRTALGMQAAMVRYSVLSSYLLSDVPPSRYEASFGMRALRTAMTCHAALRSDLLLLLARRGEEEGIRGDPSSPSRKGRGGGDGRPGISSSSLPSHHRGEARTRDEMAAYAAILHSSAVARLAEEAALPSPSSSSSTGGGGGGGGPSLMEDGGSGWGALLLQMPRSSGRSGRDLRRRGRAPEEEDDEDGDEDEDDIVGEEYPRWKWALEMACAAQEGNYQRYFSLLDSGPAADSADAGSPQDDGRPASSMGGAEGEEAAIDRARFLVLARCCASRSLNLMRLGQLRRYNQSFGKGEKVPALDMARLLRFTGDDDDDDDGDATRGAIDFCCDAGLPIFEIGGDGECQDDHKNRTTYVVMKSAPISVKGDDAVRRMCHPGRMNDAFVFGTRFVERGDTSDDGGNCKNGVESLSNEMSVMHLQQGDGSREDFVDNWEDRDNIMDEEPKRTTLAGVATTRDFSSCCEARKDEDGVLIPPSNVLRNLIG